MCAVCPLKEGAYVTVATLALVYNYNGLAHVVSVGHPLPHVTCRLTLHLRSEFPDDVLR